MSAKIGVASVGLGWWGRELARAATETDRLEVISCFARTADRRQSFAEAHGCRPAASLDDLLADERVDAILVATSNDSHLSIIQAAADAGKHVFVEKPLTLSVRDGRAALDSARDGGIIVQVGHQRRRLPAHRAMRAMVDEGVLGDLQMLEANHSLPNGFNMPDEAWRWDPDQSPLGSMTSLGIHQIDNFIYLAGPVAGISAVTRPGRPGVSSIDEATALMFDFESGALGVLTTSFFTPWDIHLSIHGTEGAAFADFDGNRLEFQVRGETDRAAHDLPEIDPVVDQLVEFAEAIGGSGSPEVGGEEALAVIAVLEAAVQSAVSGRRVGLSEVLQ